MTEPKKSIVRISDLPKGEDFYAKCKGEAVKMASWLKVAPCKPTRKKKAQ